MAQKAAGTLAVAQDKVPWLQAVFPFAIIAEGWLDR